MSREIRHPSSSSIFWPVNVDSPSTESSPVQPVIDAGKQRRSASTVEALGRQSFQIRPALADLPLRHLNSALSPATTMMRPSRIASPRLLPKKHEIPQSSQATGRDYRSRSVSAACWPKWTYSSGSTTELLVAKSGNVTTAMDSRSDDGCMPWHRNNDEASRHNSTELHCPTRHSSEPSSGLTKYPSMTSPSTLPDRRRPWISKYLQQFAETDDGEEKPIRRRKGSVAALINSFERCGTLERPSTTVPHGGRGRRTLHGSLTNIDSIGRTRRWSNGFEKAPDNNSGICTPPNAGADRISTELSLLTSQPAPRRKSYGEYTETWKMGNDHASVDDGDANTARRSSVDVIRRAFDSSLIDLNSIGRACGRRTSSENVADGNSVSDTRQNVRGKITPTKSLPLVIKDPAKDDNKDTNALRRSSSDDVTTPTTLYNSLYMVNFNQKPGPSLLPPQQRRLSVLVGRGRINNCDNTEGSTKSTSLTAGSRDGEVSRNFTGTVNHQEASDSCETVGGSTLWVSEHASESLPIADRYCDITSDWLDTSLRSFTTVDDDGDGGDFESAFWQYGNTSGLRRTGSLVSDSNNTEDSGVASSEHSLPVIDWNRSNQKSGWSRYTSKSGPSMTYRDDEDEKTSTTSYSTPPSQDHSDIRSTQSKSVMHGNTMCSFFCFVKTRTGGGVKRGV